MPNRNHSVLRRFPALVGLCLISALCAVTPRADAFIVKPGTLRAAAGKVDITPDLSGTIRLAGYGPVGRRAKGVHDPIYARAVVVSDGRRTVAIVAVDSVGIFHQDVADVRRDLGWTGPDKYLFLAATHDHSAPDTLGLWGPLPGISGVDSKFHRNLHDKIVALVQELSGRLEDADLRVAERDLDPTGLCRDSRDPAVIDPELDALQLRRKRDATAIGTIVRWPCHATTLSWNNRLITADFPGQLCRRVEDSTGGACLFLNGDIGGHLVPDVPDNDAVDFRYSEAHRIGTTVADAAIGALARESKRVSGIPIEFFSRPLLVPVENSRFLVFLHSLVAGHPLHDSDGALLPAWKAWWLPVRHLVAFPLPERLRPWVETEVSLVRIGPVEFLGVPGELFPELAIGGYDGRYRFRQPLIRPENPDPPDLAKAPKGPYLKDRLKARYGIVVGLANDELGYIVPEYDFRVNPDRSMSPMPPGHYEETFSIGKSVTPILMRGYDALLQEAGEKNVRRTP